MAAAAISNGVPPSPPPPPASQSIAASLTRERHRIAMAAADSVCLLLAVARRRIFLAAADAFICLYLASVWLIAAGVTAVDVGLLACGDDCPLTVAGYMVLAVSLFSVATFSAPATLLFFSRLANAGSNADLEKGPARRNFAAALQEVLCYTVKLGLLASMPFLMLMIAGGLLEGAVKAGPRVKAASLISAVGALGKDALYCFIILPMFSLRVWKVTRPGWGCGTTVERKLNLLSLLT
ncbi:hypothetical protein QOZ80_8BG0659520 [Eleusine coracana subsp. coracana]|nr:hypothetical protein QOZ80_8BG0659520 [Eleusine coracana subsp. coracana]